MVEPPRSSHPSKMPLAIPILVAAVCALFGGYLLLRSNIEPCATCAIPPGLGPTVVPFEQWEIYRQPVEGFSFKYPRSWNVEAAGSGIRGTATKYTVQDNAAADAFEIELNIYKPNASELPIPAGHDLKTWAIQNEFYPEDTRWVEDGFIPLAGGKGYRIVWQDTSGERGVRILLPENGKLFDFHYRFVVGDGNGVIGRQVVSTFRFSD